MRLVWAESAEADFHAIADHYRAADPAMHENILGRIVEAPLAVLDQPRSGATTGAGLRKLPVCHTSDVLLYRISKDAIEGARVLHTAFDWGEP